VYNYIYVSCKLGNNCVKNIAWNWSARLSVYNLMLISYEIKVLDIILLIFFNIHLFLELLRCSVFN